MARRRRWKFGLKYCGGECVTNHSLKEMIKNLKKILHKKSSTELKQARFFKALTPSGACVGKKNLFFPRSGSKTSWKYFFLIPKAFERSANSYNENVQKFYRTPSGRGVRASNWFSIFQIWIRNCHFGDRKISICCKRYKWSAKLSEMIASIE